MSTETRVLALFEEANPVPDIHAADREHIAPAAYLANLERRSSEMTQVDAEIDQRDRTRRVRTWMAAAAVIVVMAAIAGLTVLLTGDGSTDVPVVDDPAVVDPTVVDPPVVDPPTEVVPPTPEGSWTSGLFSAVFEDETYAFVFDGALVDRGTYSTNEERLVLTAGDDSPGCAPGQPGQWTFERTDDSSLTLAGQDDNCFFRAFIYGFELDVVMTATDPIDVAGLPTELNLDGKWGDDTTGISITGDTYAIVIDGELVDRGTFEVQTSPYLLVLDSESTEESCATATYGVALAGGEMLQLESTRMGQDDCAARSGLGMDLFAGGTFEVPEGS